MPGEAKLTQALPHKTSEHNLLTTQHRDGMWAARDSAFFVASSVSFNGPYYDAVVRHSVNMCRGCCRVVVDGRSIARERQKPPISKGRLARDEVRGISIGGFDLRKVRRCMYCINHLVLSFSPFNNNARPLRPYVLCTVETSWHQQHRALANTGAIYSL